MQTAEEEAEREIPGSTQRVARQHAAPPTRPRCCAPAERQRSRRVLHRPSSTPCPRPDRTGRRPPAQGSRRRRTAPSRPHRSGQADRCPDAERVQRRRDRCRAPCGHAREPVAHGRFLNRRSHQGRLKPKSPSVSCSSTEWCTRCMSGVTRKRRSTRSTGAGRRTLPRSNIEVALSTTSKIRPCRRAHHRDLPVRICRRSWKQLKRFCRPPCVGGALRHLMCSSPLPPPRDLGPCYRVPVVASARTEIAQ